MRKVEKYYCDLCGLGFDRRKECEEHERQHHTNWKETDRGNSGFGSTGR